MWKKSLLAMMLAVAGVGTVAAEELRFAHAQPAVSITGRAAEKFAEEVNERTGGTVQVSVYPSGQLGNNVKMVEGVRLGSIDITTNGNPFYTTFDPVLNVLDLPYLFSSRAHAYAVLDGEIGEGLLGRLEEEGLKGLAYWEIGFRNVTNNLRPIEGPGDLAGLKIRTTPNTAHIMMFELLDAHPTPMPFGEVYMSLQTGAIDGQENPIDAIYANSLNEVQKYMSLTEHAYTAQPIVMNLRRFNSLTPEQQLSIREAATVAGQWQRDEMARAAEKQLAELSESGMQITTEVDKMAFRKAVFETVAKSYSDKYGTEIIDAVLAAEQE